MALGGFGVAVPGPRIAFQDLLQTYAFWLVDISLSPKPPFFVMGSPFSAFSSANTPEMTFTPGSINEMAKDFPRHYIQNNSVAPITLTRGVSSTNSTYYQWMQRSLKGSDRVMRNLLLMQFMGYSAEGVVRSLKDIGNGSDSRSTFYNQKNPMGAGPTPVMPGSDIEILRLFGKGWVLYDCIPTRYKAGTDFDATSPSVSFEELELTFHHFTEVSLDPRQIFDTGLLDSLGGSKFNFRGNSKLTKFA